MENNQSLYTREKGFKSLIEALPVPTAIYVGRDMVIAAANQLMLDTWGRNSSIIGKTLSEALPELEGQPFLRLLDDIYTSGGSYEAKEDRADLKVDGKLQSFYFTFTYKALKNEEGHTEAIINTAVDVTEIVRNRREFANAQEYLSFALQSAEIGTWDLDPVNNTVKWDARCRELFGFPIEGTILFEDVLSCIHPDDEATVHKKVMLAIDPRTTGEYDVRYRTVGKHNQLLRWVHCKGKAYFNNEGVAYRFAGTATDITAEMKTGRREQQLLSLVSDNADFMSIADMEGKLIYMNNSARRLLDVDEAADITKYSANDFYSPEELERVQGYIIKEISEHTGWEGIVRLLNIKTREAIPFLVKYILIKDPETGEVIGRGATARDMRPEIKAKAELQRLATIVDISEDFCNYCDINGNTIYMNVAGSNLIGLDRTLISQSQLFDYHSSSSNELIRNEIIPRLRESGKWSGKLELIHQQTGEVIPIHKQLFIIKEDITGQVVAIAGIAKDLRPELNARKQQDDFLGVASHELKTPVTSIKAYVQVMESMFRRSGDLKNADLLGKINKQVNRLNSLIGDLLDVTKIKTGRMQFDLASFNFNQMVTEVVEDVQHLSAKHIINKQLNFNGEVFGDRERISQVVVNLLTNAIKYSPDASRIIVYTEHQDQHVQLCVQDFGIGINREKQDRVFEQFYRVSGTREHTFPGLGLGLYISSEIVRRMGGRIWVNSVEGKGSTFCFSIPCFPVN